MAARGTDWTIDEVNLCVDSYFEHLAIDQAGGSFVKEHIYREIARQTGRSTKAVSLKFQNVSAVLDELGRDWIRGLSPMDKYQEVLAKRIENHLEAAGEVFPTRAKLVAKNAMQEASPFRLEAPPDLKATRPTLPNFMERIIRKFDYSDRDERNRSVGSGGEEFVFNFEKEHLSLAGRSDLAKNVRWIAQEEGDGAGYDILSFTDRGEKKFIEVKTTVGKARTPFFLSRNEYQFCKQAGDEFRLVRLYDFRRDVRGFELRGDIESYVTLSTETYSARFDRPLPVE